jgi:hypothetical protein
VPDSSLLSGATKWKLSFLKAQLIFRVSVRDELEYQCSLCDHIFPLSENDTPRDAMAKLVVAFKEHVRVTHGGDVTVSEQRPERDSET